MSTKLTGDDRGRGHQPSIESVGPVQVLSHTPASPGIKPLIKSAPPAPMPVQRKSANSMLPQATHDGPTEDFTNAVFRPDLYQQPILRKSANKDGGSTEPVAQASMGSGQALPEDVRGKMERSFGTDFSSVRVHQGPQAEAVGAQAYTQGSNIHFAPGKYSPSTQSGQELIGHELAHVVQQSQGRVKPTMQAKGLPINDDASLESEADTMGAKAARGESVGSSAGSAGQAAVQRAPIQRAAAVPTPAAANAAQQRRQQAVQSLGQMRTFNDTFFQRAGTALDAMLPTVGDKGKLQLNVNFQVNPSVKIACRFVVEGERSSDGIKAKVEVGVGVATSVDVWIAEAFAQALVTGYLEVQGGNGNEVFRFLSYAIYDRVAAVSKDAANVVWGGAFARQTKAMMNGEDYVESGLGVEGSAGLSSRDGQLAHGAGVQAGVGTRITAGGRKNIGMVAGKLNFTAAPWGGEVSVKITNEGGTEKGELQASGQRTANLLDFASTLESGAINNIMRDWAARVVGSIQSLVAGGNGISSRDAGRQIGAAASLIRSSSFAAQIGSAAALRGAAKNLKALGAANIGQKLTVKLAWEPGKATLEVDLERLSNIEFGANERAPVYALLESLSRIIKIGPLTLAGK